MEIITMENAHEKVAELQKRYDELSKEHNELWDRLNVVSAKYRQVGDDLKIAKVFDYRSLNGQYVRLQGDGDRYMYVCRCELYLNHAGEYCLELYGPGMIFKDYKDVEMAVRDGISFNISTDDPQYYLDGISGFSAKPEQVEVITREELLEACHMEFIRAMGCVDESIESYLAATNDKNNENHEN